MNNVFLEYKIIFYLSDWAYKFEILKRECKRFNCFIPYFYVQIILKGY